MKDLLKGLFGGGAAYLYIIGAGVILGLWLEFDRRGAKIETLKTEKAALEQVVKNKDAVISSQARTGERRAKAQEGLDNAEKAIRGAQDGTECSNSEPIRIALDRMRDQPKGKAADND